MPKGRLLPGQAAPPRRSCRFLRARRLAAWQDLPSSFEAAVRAQAEMRLQVPVSTLRRQAPPALRHHSHQMKAVGRWKPWFRLSRDPASDFPEWSYEVWTPVPLPPSWWLYILKESGVKTLLRPEIVGRWEDGNARFAKCRPVSSCRALHAANREPEHRLDAVREQVSNVAARGQGKLRTSPAIKGGGQIWPPQDIYQLPILGADAQGSATGRFSPFCRSSIEIPSGERTKAIRPSRGGRLMVIPLS